MNVGIKSFCYNKYSFNDVGIFLSNVLQMSNCFQMTDFSKNILVLRIEGSKSALCTFILAWLKDSTILYFYQLDRYLYSCDLNDNHKETFYDKHTFSDLTKTYLGEE